MRTAHEDKAIGLSATKGFSAAAQAAYDRNTANLELTPAEQHEVGKAVALAAEQASRPKWWAGMQAAAEPTEGEAAELVAALAGYDAILAKREQARRVALEAEKGLLAIMSGGGLHNVADPERARRVERALATLGNAEALMDRLGIEVDFASEALGRARGAINANGARRQRAHVAGSI